MIFPPPTTPIIPYRDRKIDPERFVDVYRNLNKGPGKWYSIRQNGRVVAHTQTIGLTDCLFIVNQAGRDRVLKTGRKNVHAFVRGHPLLPENTPIIYNCRTKINYDPFQNSTFMVDYGNGNIFPIRTGSIVVMFDNTITGYHLR